MARNGSGGYSPPINSFNPATNGVSATPIDWNATLSDIATAIQQSISSDGQTPITGNLQMGGNRLTGLGAGSATGQSLRFEQLFSQGALVDIASAGVMDIGTPLTNFLRVTGSTTITGFGTNYNGPRYLIFAAAVILTHSATLVLPGAANITAGVNDSLIAVPISGGWQVVAYQRASGLPAVAGPLASSGITGAAASGANNDITSLTALAAGGLPDNSVLTADIANAAVTPAKLSQPFTLGTVVATTSGTAIDFTGVPAWAKRITVMLNGVSTNGTSNIIVQLGTAGSFETTGYDGGSWQANTTITAYSTGFMLGNSNAAAANVKETLVINLFDPATNTYVAFGTGAVNSANGGNAHIQGGSKALSGALTRIRITTVNGTDAFDLGSANLLIE